MTDDSTELANCEYRLRVVRDNKRHHREQTHRYAVEEIQLQTRMWTLRERIARVPDASAQGIARQIEGDYMPTWPKDT